MSNIKLIATDMDGTFLKEDGSYDKNRLSRLLPKLKEQGILFTVASGRAMIALEKVFSGFEHDLAFVAENGSFVLHDNKVLFEAKMEKNFYLKLTGLLDDLPDLTGYMLSGRQRAYALETASADYIDFVKDYYENVQRVTDLADIDDDIFKITVNFKEETIHEREAWLNQHLDGATAMTTGFQSLDIVLANVDKSTGLAAMCQKLDINPDQVLAFGDNMNDYQMLKFAGQAIATDNARQEVKAITDQVIGHCNDEAVISYMEGLVE